MYLLRDTSWKKVEKDIKSFPVKFYDVIFCYCLSFTSKIHCAFELSYTDDVNGKQSDG